MIHHRPPRTIASIVDVYRSTKDSHAREELLKSGWLKTTWYHLESLDGKSDNDLESAKDQITGLVKKAHLEEPGLLAVGWTRSTNNTGVKVMIRCCTNDIAVFDDIFKKYGAIPN